MIKSELIKTLADKINHLPIRTIEESVNLILASMTEALKNGQRIDIRNFGAWTAHDRPARTVFNPKTGTRITTKPKTRIHFKPGLELRKRVNASRKTINVEIH